jgi:hypothetical protein
MLKFTSVRSSEPQVRNPTGLKKQSPNSGFHKTMTNLLEPIPLPFPSYQLVKDSSATILNKHQFYAWKRPAHLRPHWLVVSDLGPAVLIDPRDTTRVFSIKFPFDARRVQHCGPIICEAAYDTQEATLYVWDILVWEKEEIHSKQNYSDRWKLLQYVATTILDANHPNSEIRIQLPVWESLAAVCGTPPEKEYAVEFQPEKAGQRRFLWLAPKKAEIYRPQTHHERAMVAKNSVEQKPMFVDDSDQVGVAEQVVPSVQELKQTATITKTYTQGILTKDLRSKLPDTYLLTSISGDSLGLPAIRRLDLSKQLRIYFTTHESCTVGIQWYEPFQKYEVKQLVEISAPAEA